MTDAPQLRPKLASRKIPLSRLLLDPNNPRFLTHADDRYDDQEAAEPGVQLDASERMKRGGGNDGYRIAALKDSILENGWRPVDMIFVRKLGESGNYLVLEGNRRVTALRELTKEEGTRAAVEKDVDPLEVFEVVGPPEETRAQITYLLGVRHHGSLKPWRPFAQAKEMCSRYLRASGQSEENFSWHREHAATVAKALNVSEKKLEERLRVYRVMKQLEESPGIKDVGMEGRYYSLVKEALVRRRNNPLRKHISQDANSFRLSGEAVERMDKLCHFSTAGRDGAPITNPSEWRSLARILGDGDATKKGEMIERVEERKEKPSDVFAERAAELTQPRWDLWLEEVTQVIGRIQLADLDAGDDARLVVERLDAVLSTLARPE